MSVLYQHDDDSDGEDGKDEDGEDDDHPYDGHKLLSFRLRVLVLVATARALPFSGQLIPFGRKNTIGLRRQTDNPKITVHV